ncbi:VPS10 domain-containing protein [Chryseobacterium viscerum]|uniref:PKD/Chitinase domain-containing protein n=1 Tax=Chryseobacterium viscerum TaxID=1037377 RepID=A0A5N4BJJ8_9FLAO|nr:PKD domain-containing protein [Chryseobacterium viscerum]KAB1228611.1 hypothetical protein F8D52_22015 [Chryseobacterium viscerum]
MKRIIYFLLLFLLAAHCYGQNKSMSIKDFINFSDLPVQTSDTPNWAKQFYNNPDHINIFKLQDNMDVWIKKQEKEQEKERKEKYREEENELEESISEIPIVRFALYFLRSVPSEFINSEGFLSLPSKEAYIKHINQSNSTSKTTTNIIWSQVSSDETVNSSGTNIPYQANVYNIGIAPSDPLIRIASLEVGALFKTIDGGENWTFLDDAQGPIAFHPTNPNTFVIGSSPMKQTTDGGITWTIKPVISNSNEIVWSSDGNTILAATTNGVYVSNDSGATFSQKLSGKTFHDVTFAPNSNTIAYAITNTGDFYKSTDAGISWILKPTTYSLTTTKSGYLLGTTADNPNLVVIAFLSDTNVELIKSTDSGENFAPLSVYATGFSQGFYDFVFGISPSNQNIFFLGVTTFFKSIDGGLNFTTIGGYSGSFPIHPDIQDLRFVGDSEVVLATDGGVSISSDNFTSLTNWKSTNKGILSRAYWGFDVGFNTDQMGGGQYHNGNHIYNPNWSNRKAIALGGGESPVGKTIFSRPNSIYYSDIYSGFYQADINYNTSVPKTYEFVMSNTDYLYGARISDTTSNVVNSNTIYVGKDNSIMTSDNNGISQKVLYTFGSIVWNIKTTRSDANVIYVLTQSSGLWKTTDGGITWNLRSLSLNGADFTSNGRNLYLDISQTNANELFLAYSSNAAFSPNTSRRVFRSIDGGATWINLDSNTLSQFQVKDMIHQYGTNGGIYICGSNSMGTSKCYYRNNTMADWSDFSNGLMTKTAVDRIYIRPSYFQEKLRIAGYRGIQEASFYEVYNTPIAQPTTNVKEVCINQRVKLADYSILKTAGATWNWSFTKAPIYLNGTSASSQNPEVKFLSPGNVDVTLTVTDIYNKSNTKTITNFLNVNYDNSNCLMLNSDGNVSANCVNNIPQSSNFTPGNQVLVTNFGNAAAGEFLVNINVSTNCYSTLAKLTAIVNLATNKITVLSYSHFGNASVMVTGDNTNTVTSVSNSYATISFILTGNNLYLKHISNACGSGATIRLQASCWKPYVKADGGDSDEIQKCTNTIPQSASVNNNTSITATNFNGATSGIYYVNLNAYTACGTSVNNLKAIINLDNNTINVLTYKHFGDTNTSTITGNETNSVTSTLTTNAQVTYYLNNHILYIQKNSDTCGGSGIFRLNASCWTPLDKDNNTIDDTEQPTTCNNPISTSQITDGNSYLIKDFTTLASTQNNVFVNLTINTNCSSSTAKVYLNIDLIHNVIQVINYQHFGASVSSNVTNNNSANVYSESSNIAQLKFILINKALYIKRLQTDCAGSYYEVVNSCYSTTDPDCGVVPPTGSIAQNVCQDSTLDDLTAIGNGITWYDAPSGGTLLDLSTPLIEGTTYYAAQTINNCDSSSRLPITVSLIACGAIGINIAQPTSMLDVNGSMSRKVTAVNTATTLNSTHSIVLSNSASSITITLPSAQGIKGRTYIIKSIGTGNTVIMPSNSEKIDLGNSVTLTPSNMITIVSDGAGWQILKKI